MGIISAGPMVFVARCRILRGPIHIDLLIVYISIIVIFFKGLTLFLCNTSSYIV